MHRFFHAVQFYSVNKHVIKPNGKNYSNILDRIILLGMNSTVEWLWNSFDGTLSFGDGRWIYVVLQCCICTSTWIGNWIRFFFTRIRQCLSISFHWWTIWWRKLIGSYLEETKKKKCKKDEKKPILICVFFLFLFFFSNEVRINTKIDYERRKKQTNERKAGYEWSFSQ